MRTKYENGKKMVKVDFEKLHVLVIDDETFLQNLIDFTLRAIGVGIVTTAGNGTEGLISLESSNRPIDLVICDLSMPEMDGLEFVKTVRGRADAPYARVPILILTAHSDEDIVHDAAKLGINGYLVKPVSPAALETRLRSALATPIIDIGIDC